jgi:transcriptional regulator GlxA family with amidase domain
MLSRLQAAFRRLHAGDDQLINAPTILSKLLLRAFVGQLARPPRFVVGRINPRGLAQVVASAHPFIHGHLDQPLSVDRIATAVSTSHRTLHRAFRLVLEETPHSYVTKLRLHRIRHELVSEAEAACTVAFLANRCGIDELGRFANRYRNLFGELPSETRSRQRRNGGGI